MMHNIVTLEQEQEQEKVLDNMGVIYYLDSISEYLRKEMSLATYNSNAFSDKYRNLDIEINGKQFSDYYRKNEYFVDEIKKELEFYSGFDFGANETRARDMVCLVDIKRTYGHLIEEAFQYSGLSPAGFTPLNYYPNHDIDHGYRAGVLASTFCDYSDAEDQKRLAAIMGLVHDMGWSETLLDLGTSDTEHSHVMNGVAKWMSKMSDNLIESEFITLDESEQIRDFILIHPSDNEKMLSAMPIHMRTAKEADRIESSGIKGIYQIARAVELYSLPTSYDPFLWCVCLLENHKERRENYQYFTKIGSGIKEVLEKERIGGKTAEDWEKEISSKICLFKKNRIDL